MSNLIKDLTRYEKYATYLQLKSDTTPRELDWYSGYLAGIRLAIKIIKEHRQ